MSLMVLTRQAGDVNENVPSYSDVSVWKQETFSQENEKIFQKWKDVHFYGLV